VWLMERSNMGLWSSNTAIFVLVEPGLIARIYTYLQFYDLQFTIYRAAKARL
jgi:hypothetical protein